MNRNIDVMLGDSGRRIGILRHDMVGSRESGAFEYDPQWLAAGDRFRIDPTLALVTGTQFAPKTNAASVFHSAIADAEPDGWAKKIILRDHAKRRTRARQSGESLPAILGSLDFLLQVDDFSRVGALRFRDENGVMQRAPTDGYRTAPPLLELSHLLGATRAVEANEETAADLEYLRGRGTSLGGMRPKCTVIDNDGDLCIAKFPSLRDERAYTKGEVLALKLARDAGIRTADARLEFSDSIPVALIRRFDRVNLNRLMFVSAATLLEARDNDDVEHSYTEIVDAIRQYGSAASEDIEELWRRIAFSILINNVDDHLHNHGFLHVEREQWRLSPAYDVNPFPDRARELKTWISEDAGPAATIDALMSVTSYFNLKQARAKEILAQVEMAVAGWRICGADLQMSSLELEQFADAFEHEERVAARRVSTST